MSRDDNRWIDSDEAKLMKTRLQQYADYAEPDDYYFGKFWTNGVMPRPETRSAVGEWFGLELDDASGSRVEFNRDRLTGEFVLNRLVMPLKKSDNLHGSIVVQGLETDESKAYVGYAKLFNHTSEASLLWSDDQADQLSRDIMSGHNLPLCYDRSGRRYRTWMGMHVLGRARSWEMLEKFQLGFSYDGSLNILRDQSMPEDIRDRSDRITIMHTQSLIDRPDQPVLQRSLNYSDSGGTSNITRVTTLWQKDSNDRMIPSTRHKALNVNDFRYFRRLMNEAVGEV